MTEMEWMTSQDPVRMLRFVKSSMPSERKTRLFNVAICRHFWAYLPEASRAILLKSEALADAPAERSTDETDLCQQANDIVALIDRQYPAKQFPSRDVRIQRDSAAAACYAVMPNELFGAAGYLWEIDPATIELHPIIIRDVFDSRFRPTSLDPSWLTWNDGTILKLAKDIYHKSEFGRLPELADALEYAGCQNSNLLDHCRQPVEHVRGCWAVDLILGKA